MIFSIAGNIDLVYAADHEIRSNLEIEKLKAEIKKLDKETEKLNQETNLEESASDPTIEEKTRLEIDKLKLEVANLKKETPIYDTATGQQVIIAVIGIIAGAVTGSITWYQSKKITPFSDKEKTFHELTIKRHHNLYRENWKKVQHKILDSPNDVERKNRVKAVWKSINRRDFPKEEKEMIWREHLRYVETQAREGGFLFKAKQSQLKDKDGNFLKIYDESELIEKLAESIAQSSYEEYFKGVEKKLPSLVLQAVTKTQKNKKIRESEAEYIGNWEEDAVDEIMELMIFNNISEYELTIRTMINVKIRELIADANKPKPSK